MAYEFNENKKVIVIAHPSKKRHYLGLKAKNPYLDMEVMTLDELKGMFDYQHDDRALVFVLQQKEGYGYKVANEILTAISSRHYERGVESKKFDELRNRLIKDGLLFKLPYPEKTFEGADILVSGYFTEDETIKEYLGNVILIHDEVEQNDSPMTTYMKFTDIYEELHYVFNQIAADLDQGTPIENIYIYGVNNDYTSLLKQFSKYYGFTVDVEVPCRLFDTNIYRLFRAEYLENDLETAILKIREAYKDNKDADSIEKFARVFESTFKSNKDKTVSIFDEIAKQKTKHTPSKKNVIKVLPEAVCDDNAHLYFVNFAMGTYPKAPSEGGYFSDEEKERIGLDTAKSISRRDQGIIEHALRSKSLKLITFAAETFGTAKFECAFKDKYNMTAIENPHSSVEYAKDKGAFLCANLQDSKRNYLEEDSRRKVYEGITNIEENYPNYDNSFNGKKTGRKTSKSHSYSSLKTYRQCPFKYLYTTILKLDAFEDNFGASIGNVFHGVFEQYYKDQTIDFDTAFENSFKMEQGLIPNPGNIHDEEKKEFTPKEKAIVENLKEYCKIAFDFQCKYEKYLQNPRYFPEESFEINLDNGVKVIGRYDKITEFEYNNKKYCFIIDYKTNDESFDEKLFRNFGLSLQLPVYAMAITRGETIASDSTLAGLFISPLLNVSLENKGETDISVQDQENLKLKGVFLNDANLFNGIDPMMEDKKGAYAGSYIQGLRISKKDGVLTSSAEFKNHKTLDELKELGDLAENYIKTFDEKIGQSDFRIDPLVIKGKSNACEYCKFHDVCYVDKRKIKVVSPNGEAVKEEEGENGEF